MHNWINGTVTIKTDPMIVRNERAELIPINIKMMLKMSVHNFISYTSTRIYIYMLGIGYNNTNTVIRTLTNVILFLPDVFMTMSFLLLTGTSYL